MPTTSLSRGGAVQRGGKGETSKGVSVSKRQRKGGAGYIAPMRIGPAVLPTVEQLAQRGLKRAAVFPGIVH